MRPPGREHPFETLPGMRAIEGLVHAVTTRAGGASAGAFASLNLGRGTGDDEGLVAANRRRTAAALGFAELTVPRQVHGAVIRCVERAREDPGACDGLSTDRPGILLGVLGADCPGVLLVEPSRRVLAVLHAGWRGVAGGIIATALAHLQSIYGVTAEQVCAGIGPGISRERYEVSEDVADRIRASLSPRDASPVIRPGRPGHAHVDLVAAIRTQLVACGVDGTAVGVHGACTFDDARFFSHRGDRGITGRHAVLAGWSQSNVGGAGSRSGGRRAR